MLLGVDSWSFSFACGVRDVKPAKRMTALEMLAKVRQWGLKGAQVGLGEMPKLDSSEFESLRKAIADAGFDTLAGSATLADVISALNNVNSFLSTQLVKVGKQ